MTTCSHWDSHTPTPPSLTLTTHQQQHQAFKVTPEELAVGSLEDAVACRIAARDLL